MELKAEQVIDNEQLKKETCIEIVATASGVRTWNDGLPGLQSQDSPGLTTETKTGDLEGTEGGVGPAYVSLL